MIALRRTNADHHDFKALVQLLNAELARRDGADHPLSRFNNTDKIKYVLMAYDKDIPIACGAIQAYDAQRMEIKRMFVRPENRGKGIAKKILEGLELWTKELSYHRCILLTGSRQPEANRLYAASGYRAMPKYGEAADIIDSRCFEKVL